MVWVQDPAQIEHLVAGQANACTANPKFDMKPASLVALLMYTTSAGAAGLGVTDAWQAAMHHDPTFEAARAQWEAGRTHVEQGRALWLPTLSASGRAGWSDQETHSSGAAFSAPGFGSTNGVDFRTSVNGGTARQWAIVAEQPLFDADRAAASIGHSNVAAVADAQFGQARQDLLLRTARAYFSVLNSRARLDALRRLHVAAELARTTARARYESGDIPATDMREAQASADAIGVQQLDAQAAVALSEAAFSDLTGLDALALKSLPVREPAELPTTDALEVWTQRALAQSPQLAVQQLALAAASAQLDRYRRPVSPRISVVAQLGRESLQGSGDFGAAGVTAREASVALQASIPLFTGGMRSAQRHEARALERKEISELRVAELHVRQQVRAAWLGLNTASARVRALQRLHDSTAERLAATRLGVEIGGRTVLELLDAESDFLSSGTDFQKAQADWLLADLELRAFAGGLSEADLKRVDQHLVDRGTESR